MYQLYLITNNKFDITTLQGFRKFLFYDLIIIDEIHKFVSSDRLFDLMPKIVDNSAFRLGLLGVISDEIKPKIEKFAPIIDTISETEAIENKWISDYTEYNIPLELSDDDKLLYANYTSAMKETLEKF